MSQLTDAEMSLRGSLDRAQNYLNEAFDKAKEDTPNVDDILNLIADLKFEVEHAHDAAKRIDELRVSGEA